MRMGYKDDPLGGGKDEDWRAHNIACVAEEAAASVLSYRPVHLDPLTTLDEGGINHK